MPEKVHRIHSLPDDAPWSGGLPPQGSAEHPLTVRALDRVLAVQRPVVLAHLRGIRVRHPDAATVEIVRMLERRYLAAVTTGGATVGATAVVPGIGTGMTLALSGVETLGFLEATTLFAQSVAEVHGMPIENPDRARALVLTLLLGQEGIDLVTQLAGQAAGRGPSRDAYWGELVTKTIPRVAVGPLVDRLKTSFVRRFAARGGASWLGKALPFGVGAAVGGTGNHILGRRVITTSRRAFGMPPLLLPPDLEPRPDAAPLERMAATGIVRAGGAVVGAAGAAARGAGRVARGIGAGTRRAGAAAGSARRAIGARSRSRDEDPSESGADAPGGPDAES